MVAEGYAKEAFGLSFSGSNPVALQEMAKKKQSLRNMTVIGVTGSVGKTTTKEFIAQILKPEIQSREKPREFQLANRRSVNSVEPAGRG